MRGTNAIEIKGLTKKRGGFTLKSMDLILPSGYIMGLIGENGAGKSTVIRLILDMIKRDGGSVSVLGSEKMTRLAKEDIGTVLDEVGMPECLDISEVNKVMKLTYKNWDEDAFFGYVSRFDIPKDKRFKEFSRGNRMKLGIAAALSHGAKLLIFDEATNGLDPVVRDEVNDILMEFTRDEGHSVLISSHIVSDLERICDYIAFLYRGELLLCEEKDRLREEYVFVQCSGAEIERLPREAVIGARRTVYSAEAVVKKSFVTSDMKSRPVTTEELFVFMVGSVK